ncbi:hypothetical protein Tco_0336330 [Tanacetum coccineum]
MVKWWGKRPCAADGWSSPANVSDWGLMMLVVMVFRWSEGENVMKVDGYVACRCGRQQVTRKWRWRPNEGGRGNGDVEDRGDGGVGVAWTGCGGRKSRRRWETRPENERKNKGAAPKKFYVCVSY